jgi:hypothetical protein
MLSQIKASQIFHLFAQNIEYKGKHENRWRNDNYSVAIRNTNLLQ